jgi:large subunit ribosomal protein L5
VITKSKLAISNFKLRAGEPLGVKVTLRDRNMYLFLERLIKLAIPVIRDFRGVSAKAFDGRGNYTLGIKDQTIFPEIELDKVKRTLGFDVCIVTSAKDDNSARELLAAMGMPFRKSSSQQAA